MKNILPIIFLVIFSSLLYLLTLRGVPGNLSADYINTELKDQSDPFELSPERGRYTLIMSMADYGSFELPENIALIAMPDVGYQNGKFYTLFAPGVSVMTLPLYVLGKNFGLSQVFTFSAPALMGVFNSILIYLLAREFGAKKWASMASSLIFGFSTISWSYAVTLYQHHFTVFFMLLAFYGLVHFKKRKYIGYLLAWFSYGAALTLDSPNPLLLLPLMVYMLSSAVNWKTVRNKIKFSFNFSIVLASIVFFIVAAFYGYYNKINFGGWASLSGTIPRYKEVIELANEKSAQEIADEKTAVGLFDARRLHRGLYTLIFSDDRGIILFSPVVIIGFIGLISVHRKYAKEVSVVFAIIGMSLFLYGSFGDPWGGWAFGPRYLIPSMALLSIFVGVALTEFKAIWLKLLLVVAAIYSSAIALVGALTTNAVPPKIEAIHLPVAKYNFLLNLDYLKNDKSSSLLYNYYFNQWFSLQEYYLFILSTLILVFIITILVIPVTERRKS